MSESKSTVDPTSPRATQVGSTCPYGWGCICSSCLAPWVHLRALHPFNYPGTAPVRTRCKTASLRAAGTFQGQAPALPHAPAP